MGNDLFDQFGISFNYVYLFLVIDYSLMTRANMLNTQQTKRNEEQCVCTIFVM